MKLLMVSLDTQESNLYGVKRSLAPLVDELRRRGIEVDYVNWENVRPQTLLRGSRSHRILSSLLARWHIKISFLTLIHLVLEHLNTGRIAAKTAAKRKYTHVHCHNPIIAAGFHFFSKFYPGNKPKWGITEHGFGCYSNTLFDEGVRIGARTMRWLRKWEAKTLLSASWVIAPTRTAMIRLASDINISPTPVGWQYIYHAQPDIKRYGRKEARQKLNWNDDVFYVLGVGRIKPIKQFPLLIQACAGLIDKNNVQIVIVGEGDYKELLEMGKRLGLVRDIIFLTTKDIGLYMSAADLYVSTSASESFGFANLEALTAGIASVCMDSGGVPEVVGNGAILVRPERDLITNAIQNLMDDSDLRQRIARNGRARAEAWPNIVDIANKYETLYR